MPRKATTRRTVQVEEEPTESKSSLFDYLRFGESYTSLILGIIVVIISTVLLLSFVHNKNTNKQDNPQLLSQKDIALPSDIRLTGGPSQAPVKPTAVPTKKVEEKKVAAAIPTATPTPKPAAKPTLTPTPTKAPAAKVTPTQSPTKVALGTMNPSKTEYTVGAGDNLWSIAEKAYNSGYNWVDIARANKLSSPGVIHVGDKLKLPKVDQKIATAPNQNQQGSTVKPKESASNDKINGSTYTAVKGDSLWSISVRAYGDGFQWKKIASANNLSNPRVIHSGNILKIPRG